MYQLGKSREEVGQMTIFDVMALFAYWREVPPADVSLLSVVMFLGGKRPASEAAADAPRTTAEQEDRSAATLASVLRGAGV